jgi:hypothetical protein
MTFLLEVSELALVHVALSLVALAAGVAAVAGMLVRQRHDSITALFLITTAGTSISGFLFPRTGFTPAQGVGIVSLVVLLFPLLGLYVFAMRGWWRPLGIAGAVAAFYLNAFEAMVQAFQRIPALRALAPTQTQAPFLIAQAMLLLIFIAIGVASIRRCHPDCIVQSDAGLGLDSDRPLIG